MATVRPQPQARTDARELATLESIERRLLWLAIRIVDFANRERPSTDPLKVGGHQASCASVTTLMTALYFHALRAEDRIAIKPHAAPVLHAAEYLLGRLPRTALTTLRDFHGLQAYPSRTKDRFPVDFSTGSVGLGAAAPLFSALAHGYLEDHFGAARGGRFISLVGDAELDEGNVWEALFEPQTRNLRNVLWIVDVNRQSLDRVVATLAGGDLAARFAAAGWHVIELTYGRALRRVFAQHGGNLFREALESLTPHAYQALLAADDNTIGETLLASVDARERSVLARVLAGADQPFAELVRSLGGHDLADVLDALALAETTPVPTVILASTIKGYGLPFAGHPANHSALLSAAQVDELRAAAKLTPGTEWDAFAKGSAEDMLCHRAAARLARRSAVAGTVDVPRQLRANRMPRTSTQDAFGRILLELSRVPEVAERVVTVSPDVSVSTNLGGWINKVGSYARREQDGDDGEAALRWRPAPSGRHLELGICEMNLFLLLGQLGLTAEHFGERLLPIGTVYDPFVLRGLEGLLYSVYNDARFVVAGTPSGISLSREGGAHQSTITPGVGMELPGLLYAEPCYAQELEWLLLDGLQKLQEPRGESLYLRLATKPVDQRPFLELAERRGEDDLRADVLAGGYRIREPAPLADQVVLVSCGALVPETLDAAELLESEEGVGATVVVASSADRLYRDWRRARLAPLTDLMAPRTASHLERLVGANDRASPLVTVLDGASHALAFAGSCLGRPAVPLGVDNFGQTGSLAELYEEYQVGAEAIALAALIALEDT
jgi:pyruvate dehydrogenase E1 component